MLLAIDAGNSTVAFGLYPFPEKRGPLHVAKVPTDPHPSAAQCGKVMSRLLHLPANGQADGGPREPGRPGPDIIISSVVPRLNRTLVAAARDMSRRKPLMVSHRVAPGLSFHVANPSRIGADRIANAVAASHIFKGPVAVVDCGTATTITVVGPGKIFLGGAIMPGLSVMRESLYRSAARLPRAPLVRPEKVLAGETSASISSGVIYGTAGAVRSLVHGIEKELGFRVQLVLTGGQGALLSPLMGRRHRLMPTLTFEGLRLIHLRNIHPAS